MPSGSGCCAEQHFAVSRRRAAPKKKIAAFGKQQKRYSKPVLTLRIAHLLTA
jgi:hypothetical protein